jgi:hypothetical protein
MENELLPPTVDALNRTTDALALAAAWVVRDPRGARDWLHEALRHVGVVLEPRPLADDLTIPAREATRGHLLAAVVEFDRVIGTARRALRPHEYLPAREVGRQVDAAIAKLGTTFRFIYADTTIELARTSPAPTPDRLEKLALWHEAYELETEALPWGAASADGGPAYNERIRAVRDAKAAEQLSLEELRDRVARARAAAEAQRAKHTGRLEAPREKPSGRTVSAGAESEQPVLPGTTDAAPAKVNVPILSRWRNVATGRTVQIFGAELMHGGTDAVLTLAEHFGERVETTTWREFVGKHERLQR